MKYMKRAMLAVLTAMSALSAAVLAGSTLPQAVQVGEGCDHNQVSDLKSQIVAISTANQTRRDNIQQVRAQLQPLVNELISCVEDRTEAEKTEQVAGGWYSLWSDYTFGPFVDYAQVYQVVDKAGFYYNISKNVAPFGIFTNYLRGAFSDAGDVLRIEFTRSIMVDNWLTAGTSLTDLSDAVESGAIDGPDVPRGPIGVQGNLKNAYVDGELRVVSGRTDGESADGLFVLVRADVVR